MSGRPGVDVMIAPAVEPKRHSRWLRTILEADAARAGRMAIAASIGNVITLLLTIAFAHLLGASDYGSLVALISVFFIASIPGTAIQTVIAREVSAMAEREGEGGVAHHAHNWTLKIVAGTAILVVPSLLLRVPLAAILGVDQPWAAALILPTAGLWTLVALQRGVLQGLRSYNVVGASVIGEALARLVVGVILIELGLSVTGAFGGLTAALLILAIALGRRLPRPTPDVRGLPIARARTPLLRLLRNADTAVLAMGLLVVIQNLDVIVVKHTAPAHAAGVYASASITAKALVWIAVGISLYALPETSHRFLRGQDTRRLFRATLVLMGAIAAAALATFGVAARPLLEVLFGRPFGAGAPELLLLGTAMTAFAFTYLTVQYLVAVHETNFLWILVAAVIVEPLALAAFGSRLVALAAALLVLHVLLASLLLALALRHSPRLAPTESVQAQ
jgi:O-antigen/teichoic acid export membrane protein